MAASCGQKWSDIGVFVKYGMLSEEKFYDAGQKFALLKNLDGEHFTIEEYRDKVKDTQTDKDKRIVMLYSTQPKEHFAYIEGAKAKGYDVLECDQMIDNHFIQHLEQKLPELSFKRVDADTVDELIQKDEQQESVLSDADKKLLEKFFNSCGVAKAYIYLGDVSQSFDFDNVVIPLESDADYVVSA